jgi:hypothetical protein
VNQRGLMGSRRKPLFKIGLFYLRIRMRRLEPKDKIVSYLIKINNEDQGPTRRGPQGSTFTNKINYSLINVLNTLARVPRWIDKARNQIITKLTKEEGEELPQNIFLPSGRLYPSMDRSC